MSSLRVGVPMQSFSAFPEPSTVFGPEEEFNKHVINLNSQQYDVKLWKY